MLARRLSARLNHLLRHSPAVVLVGPRQAGKTTLALEIGEQEASIYLDLEDEDERAKLSNPPGILRITKASWSSWMRFTACLNCFSGCGASSTGAGGAEKQMGGFCFSDQPPWTCSSKPAKA